MNALTVLKETLNSCHFCLNLYLSDLTDKELLERPTPEANSIAWQLGHLIFSEYFFLNCIKEGASPKLPDGFAEAHSKEASKENWITPKYTKTEYLEFYNKQRAACSEILATLTEEDLDKPGPEKTRSYAATIGNIVILLATHEMMHAGQFAVLRRKLGKPIVM